MVRAESNVRLNVPVPRRVITTVATGPGIYLQFTPTGWLHLGVTLRTYHIETAHWFRFRKPADRTATGRRNLVIRVGHLFTLPPWQDFETYRLGSPIHRKHPDQVGAAGGLGMARGGDDDVARLHDPALLGVGECVGDLGVVGAFPLVQDRQHAPVHA